MDCLSLASVGILMENDNGGTLLGGGNCSGCDNGDIHDLVAVYPLNVHRTPCLLSDMDISSSNATVCCAISQ